MKLISYLFALLLLVSCTFNDTQTESVSDIPSTTTITPTLVYENFENGKVIVDVKCKSDTTNSYTLYIPSTYDGKVPFPVILFFDSQGNGSFPVKKYKSLAEQYGFIVAGSNNSKNGVAAQVNGAIAGTLLTDVVKRMNINSKRIYTCGFSGGSRVASYVAIYRGGINTVIGCGAGLPAIDKQIENKFNYIGIAGDEDFNYTEMEDLEELFSKSDIEHIFIPFNGKHEWCPVETMERALIWVQLKAMKQFLLPKNDSLMEQFLISENLAIDSLLKNKKEVEAFERIKQAINFTSGLTSSASLKSSYTKLENSTVIKKAQARKEELRKVEKMVKEQYLNALAVKDTKWWENETLKLNDAAKFPHDQLAMNKRIFAYLSLACYMNINQMLTAKQLQEAEHFSFIYKTIDPSNAEAPYLLAKIYDIKNEKDNAIQQLREAAQKGFTDYNRITNDFSELLKNNKATDILASVEKNKLKEIN